MAHFLEIIPPIPEDVEVFDWHRALEAMRRFAVKVGANEIRIDLRESERRWLLTSEHDGKVYGIAVFRGTKPKEPLGA